MMHMLVIISILLLLIIGYINYIYNHWSRAGIIQLQPSFPFGNIRELLLKKQTFGLTFKSIYDKFRILNQPIGGYYFVLKPAVIIVDPELIKCVLIKDFTYFSDRGIYLDERNDPLSAHLFSLPCTKWRPLRMKLTSTFTSGKMKMMFSTVMACSKQLKQVLDKETLEGVPVDMKDILSRFTIDVIGSCAFGIECNSLKNPENEFRRRSGQIIEVKGLDVLRQILAIAVPSLMSFLRIPGVNPKCTSFFLNVVKQTTEYRAKNEVSRNDFMQLLLELKKTSDLTIKQIAAQCFVFFLAGFETASTTMTFCLFELAQNEEIQNNVRNEIFMVLERHNNELTYEALMEMQYLDKCVLETLRKYPPLPFLNREVVTDYDLNLNLNHVTVNNSTYWPENKASLQVNSNTADVNICNDDEEICISQSNHRASIVRLRKGTPVIISVLGLHWDSKLYPQPERFNPERFNETEKSKRPRCSYLPFGDGPRNCIAQRFGMMQTKVGLVEVLRQFKLTVSNKTRIPLKMTTKTFITAAEGGIWLNLQKVQQSTPLK